MKKKNVQKNIELIRRLFDEQASRDDISLYDEFFSEEVRLYGPASGQVVQGLATLKKIDEEYNKDYPGKKFQIEEIFGQGDDVVIRWTCRGSYREGHKGIRPKKREFEIWGVSMYHFEKGKVVEIRTFWDRLGILEQIGEIHVATDPVKPGDYHAVLKSLGMEKYLEKAPLLSKRERDCLELLLQGKTAKETAAQLKISNRTVESYFENIKRKLKCSNKGQLFSTAQTLKKLELI